MEMETSEISTAMEIRVISMATVMSEMAEVTEIPTISMATGESQARAAMARQFRCRAEAGSFQVCRRNVST
jgi:hypothetical protein